MKMKAFAIWLLTQWLISCQSHHKSDIPAFDLLLSDSTTLFHTADIPEGRPIVMLFFSPTCGHCQEETASLLKKMDSLKHVNFYFLTIDPMEDMRLFNKVYRLDRYTNITIGRDYKFFFPVHFKSVTPPYSLIYDGDKRLRGAITGQADASKFIAIINKL